MSRKNEYFVPETISEMSEADSYEEKKPAKEETAQECTHYIYVGPSVPNGKMKNGAVYNGTINDIKAYLAEDLAAYPAAEKLIIPLDDLAEVQAKVNQSGNSYNNHYNETAALITAKKKED